MIKKAFYDLNMLLLGFFLLFSLSEGKAEDKSTSLLESRYQGIVSTVAKRYYLPPELIHSIIRAESNYDPFAISPKGAMGLMQLMPETARIYKVKNVFDPQDNIEGGVRYLNDLIKLFNSDTDLVLAAYNAGQEAVKKYGGIPPYLETKSYIKNVMRTYSRPTIKTKTIIYKFYDESGRLVLTNIPYIYSSQKKKKE
jgi:soluble lytic murein transglycosylase-like protein